ncbi:hypothetical protein ACFX11_014027 [Malus domestica]
MAAKAQGDNEDDDPCCVGPWCSTPSSRSRTRWTPPSPFGDLARKGSAAHEIAGDQKPSARPTRVVMKEFVARARRKLKHGFVKNKQKNEG